MNDTRVAPRSTVVREKTSLCLSCPYSHIRVSGERNVLAIRCRKGHSSAVACPDYAEDGRSALLGAIVQHIRKTQRGYRTVFNIIQPDCPNCTSNCCTRPFLQKTPFYGEDAIYYLLIGEKIPPIPKGVAHCYFFDNGCTLLSPLRPQACIEYKWPFVEKPPKIDVLGDQLQQDVLYLLAVATKNFDQWRGRYEEVDVRGGLTGRTVDRFNVRWDPDDPLADLEIRYGVTRLDEDATHRGSR